jgi:hypothetical protein
LKEVGRIGSQVLEKTEYGGLPVKSQEPCLKLVISAVWLLFYLKMRLPQMVDCKGISHFQFKLHTITTKRPSTFKKIIFDQFLIDELNPVFETRWLAECCGLLWAAFPIVKTLVEPFG